jgi:hypothetical protein
MKIPKRLAKECEPLRPVFLATLFVLACAAGAGVMTITASRLVAAVDTEHELTVTEGPRQVELDAEAGYRIRSMVLETLRAADGATDRIEPYRRWFPRLPTCTQAQEARLRCAPVAFMAPPADCTGAEVAKSRAVSQECTPANAPGNGEWYISAAEITASEDRVEIIVDLAQFVEPIPVPPPDAGVHELAPSSNPANPRDPRRSWRGKARCEHDRLVITLPAGHPLQVRWHELAADLLGRPATWYGMGFACSEDHQGEFAGAQASLDESGQVLPRGTRARNGSPHYVGVDCRPAGARIEGGVEP